MIRLSALALLAALTATPTLAQEFVVANRASADFSVFDAGGAFVQTLPMPPAVNTPEPMYVVQAGGEVVIGDRANDRVVRFDEDTYAFLGEVPVGAGVFHMWAADGQLWVNGDIDDTTTVIDTLTWQVLATVPTPAALEAQGYKPHDVYVGDGFAYISLLAGTGPTDWVLQVDASTFAVLARVPVGKDPHLWLNTVSDTLYVASQDSSEVLALASFSMDEKDRMDLPGAHGIFMPPGTRTLLVADITSPGAGGLSAIRLRPNGRFGPTQSVAVPFPVAHNISASALGETILVTHSGATSTKVSVYSFQPSFQLLGTGDAGLNPFGLARID